MKRRDFFKIVSLGGVSFALNPVIKASELTPLFNLQEGPETNIADAVKIPRTKNSMPGLYPGKVVKVTDPASVIDGKPQEDAAY
ncbi:MAG TPA: hypothetical protein DF637_05690, partial [Rikenellaceae bacterium]|nr:hypothetical protein [Rikenellaceae bacterium]